MSYARVRAAMKSYGEAAVQSDVNCASPHRLIQMLMEGALEKISKARGFMQRGEITEKGNHISWALSIINGLRMSLDKEAGGEIAQNLGAKVLHQDWLGFGAQKNKAVELAKNDWVFVLDSDERITDELQLEILNTLKNPTAEGYHTARLNNFFGKNIRHCGLYPDYSIRLFNRQKGKFNDVTVHESVQIQGNTNKLKNHMIHLAFDTVEEFSNKQRKYAALSQKKKSLIKL